MNRVFCQVILLLGLGLFFNGCASPATVSGMINNEYSGTIPPSKKMQHSIQLAEVEGGSETHPLWTSQVSGHDFKEALRESLKNAGFTASDDKNTRYVLKADLLRLEQPLFGLDMTVATTVKYMLVDKSKSTVVWTQEVTAVYTAKIGDAFMGVTRLRLANEGSAKKNIGQLLGALQGLDPDKVSVSLN